MARKNATEIITNADGTETLDAPAPVTRKANVTTASTKTPIATRKTILDYAVEVLTEQNKPLHSGELTTLMLSKGWTTAGPTAPAHVAYTALHGYTSRKGAEGRVIKLPRGYYSLPAHAPDFELPEKISNASNQPSRSIVSDIPEEKRHCGNCAYIDFNDIQVVNKNEGSCLNYMHSKHNGVRSCDVCPLWKERTAAMFTKDANRAIDVKLTVAKAGINGTSTKRKQSNKETATV